MAVPDAKADLVTVSVVVGDSSQLRFKLSPSSEGTAYFCLGVRKSGSTMLNKIVAYLARRNEVPTVDIPGAFFNSGFGAGAWANVDLSDVVRPNNIYMGFRSYPERLGGNDCFRNGRKILLFRDTRDALVSQYFSDAYSHSLPSGETDSAANAAEAFLRKREKALATDINTYVIEKSRSFANTMLAYKPLLTDDNCLVLRYEDYIFQKKRLIHKILDHFGWRCHSGQIENLLGRIDDVPEIENEKKFVRKVIPGDHREKLSSKTIQQVDGRLREVLALFDYY